MSQKSRAYQKLSKIGLAIVTGGSSGIGKSIVEATRKLVPGARVFNLSRHKPSSFSFDHYSRHLECDLADRTQRAEVFQELMAALPEASRGQPILLVNNSGFGTYGAIGARGQKRELDMLEVNICALVELTTALLPTISRQGGAIVNIASVAAFGPVPQMATYAAAKSFVLHWTLALAEELRGTDARAIAVCPGPTRTAFHERAGAVSASFPLGAASPDAVADAVLRALDRRSPLLTPGFANRASALLASALPKTLVARIAGRLLKSTRAAADAA